MPGGNVSAVDDAIHRWWLHDRPNIERVLRHAYNVGKLADDVTRMLHRGLREAFIAGWQARGRQQVAGGEQGALFDEGPSKTETT